MPEPGGTGASEVRQLAVADVPFAAALHREALPDGFFVALGDEFLRRYYEAFISSPHAVALIAVVAGEPRGVLVGTVDQGSHYRWLVQRRRTALALAALRALVRRPRLAVEFIRTRARRYLRGAFRLRRSRPARPAHGPTTGHLTHVAVVPESRTNGVGSALVGQYSALAFAEGALRLRVATQVDGGVAEFYRRLGWRDAGSMQNLDGIDFDVLMLDR